MNGFLLTVLFIYGFAGIVTLFAGLLTYATHKGPQGDPVEKRAALNMIRYSFLWPIAIIWAVVRRIPGFLLDLARDLTKEDK